MSGFLFKHMIFCQNTSFPKYDGGSICNILPSLAKMYSIKSEDGIERVPLYSEIYLLLEKLTRGVKKIIIFEIDGLGFDRFIKIRSEFPFLKENVFKVTSTFPTYTHSAFASFLTGTPPSYHGIVAGTFKIDNEVKWVGVDFDSKNLFLADSLLREFEKNGFKTYSILYDVNDNRFSRYLYPKRIFVPSRVSAQNKNLIKEAKLVERRVFKEIQGFAEKDFFILTAYFWYLDGITGKYGKFSSESINHCRFLFKEIDRLQKNFPRDTLFIFMGDHGHISLKKNILLDEKKIQEISNLSNASLALDGRTLMFYSDKLKLTKKLFRKYYGRYVREISKKDYLSLLGPEYSSEIRKRVGDLIYEVVPHCTFRLRPKDSKATHGGRSKEEMETVFGFWRI